MDYADIHIVNCRIGSLENAVIILIALSLVNCRIGSLETQTFSDQLRRGC